MRDDTTVLILLGLTAAGEAVASEAAAFVRETPTGQERVTAHVSFQNMGHPGSMTLRLDRGKGGWRIADIGSESMPSLVDVLREGLGKK